MTTTLAKPVRRVLCATDFSRTAKVALDWASSLARSEHAELDVVHTWQLPQVMSPAGTYVPVSDLAKDIEGDIARELDRVCEGRQVTGKLVVRGPPDVGVTSAADETRADLIVVGTHGRSGLAHVLLGSVADRIIRTANVPVVTVPAVWDERSRAQPLVRRALVAVDPEGSTEPAIVEALGFAKRLGAEVDLVHVLEAPAYLMRHEAIVAEMERSARASLAELAGRHVGTASTCHLVVRRGSVAETVVATAAERDVDLIVLPTHGRIGAERFFFGSIAERVARLAKRPILTIRAGRSGAAP